MRTLIDILAEIRQDLSQQKIDPEKWKEAQKEAKGYFLLAYGDPEEIRELASKLFDITEESLRIFENQAEFIQWVRPLETIAELAQRYYELEKPRLDAEKALQTKEGLEVIKILLEAYTANNWRFRDWVSTRELKRKIHTAEPEKLWQRIKPLLQAGYASTKIFQDPDDHEAGLTHVALTFEGARWLKEKLRDAGLILDVFSKPGGGQP